MIVLVVTPLCPGTVLGTLGAAPRRCGELTDASGCNVAAWGGDLRVGAPRFRCWLWSVLVL